MENKQNLNQALELFIKAMRLFISTEMSRVYGENWEVEYLSTLNEKQKLSWIRNKNEGKTGTDLIDFSNLFGFALNQKDLLRGFAGKYTNNLPAKFSEINDVRNDHAHYHELDQEKADKAFLHMIDITRMFNMPDVLEEIRKFYRGISKINNTPNYWEYSTLYFSKKKIDPLLEDQKFTIRVKKTKESFTMTKREFYRVFDNVVNSNAYKIGGVFTYPTIPKKAYQFLSTDLG
jgi:hypothetical protein